MHKCTNEEVCMLCVCLRERERERKKGCVVGKEVDFWEQGLI